MPDRNKLVEQQTEDRLNTYSVIVYEYTKNDGSKIIKERNFKEEAKYFGLKTALSIGYYEIYDYENGKRENKPTYTTEEIWENGLENIISEYNKNEKRSFVEFR